LAKHGFSGLRVVRGGILAWRDLGYPTEGNAVTEGSLGLNNA
jgi:rhodanese-related sulfurtransferase